MCPRLELLLAEAEGVLPEDAAARVREHLAGCAQCRGMRDETVGREPDPLTDAENRRIRARIAGAVGT